MTSAPLFTALTAATLADELSGLLYRYGDLIRAETEALEDENVSKASMLAKSAEAVLAQANRIDRHLVSARSAHQPDTVERREMDRRLLAATAHVREQVAQLGQQLATERSGLLQEIGRLEPQGGGHAPHADWAVAPTILNVRT